MKKTYTIISLFIGVALLVALVMVTTFKAFNQIEESTETRKHVNVVLNRSDDLLFSLINAETGQRGYLLTGDEAFLEPYLAVRDSISDKLKKLHQLTNISRGQKHLDALVPLIDEKLADLSFTIELYRNHHSASALTNVRGSRGKQLMDSIRAELNSFIQIEKISLVQREAEFQSNMRFMFTIIIIAGVCTLLFALSFAFLVYREIQHKLKNTIHLETEKLLEVQEETNKQLQWANFKLQVSEEKFEVTIHSIGDAVIATDAEGKITILNSLAEKLTGWTQREATGLPVDDIVHIISVETRAPITVPLKDALLHGTKQDLLHHTLLIARDGSERDIADSCTPIRDRDGIVVGAVMVFRDVSEFNRIENQIKILSEQQQTILDASPAMIFYKDKENRFIRVNEVMAKANGTSKEEMEGKSCWDIYSRELADKYWEDEKVVISTGQPKLNIIEILETPKGTLNVQSDKIPYRDSQGAIIGIIGFTIDITARKQAEEALLKAGALQEAIFNSANFSSIATDAKGVIQIFNVGAERMLGYTASEVMNKITPADISDPQEVIARAKVLSTELSTSITPGFEALVFKASRGIEDIYELTYIRKDGSRLPAVVSVTALRDDNNSIIGYLLIGTDNTARKKAETALLKAGALQNAIFNSANFSSIATDEKGVIQIFNVGAERMLGYTAAEVMNKITPADISDPQEVIVRAKALSLELSTPITPGFEALVFKASRGIEDIYELTYIRRDGSRFPAVVSVTALRDEQNTIIGYLLIGTDNTARKQIEAEQTILAQRLRDHQFYTRSLFEANIDALMTTDPSGIITDVNKQMEILTDCTRDELIGAPFKIFFTEPEVAQASINQVLNERKVTNYELTARTREGKETVVSYNATTFYDRDRKLQGVFAAARDITERKQLDQVLLEKNIELENSRSVSEKANLAKSNFLSSMSHELRSPLNAILGFAQLMQTAVPAPTKPQKESITQILQSGWHLLKLINEVLDLAVVESGKVSLSQEPVSLGELISECEAMFVPEGHKRNIKMIFPEFYAPMFVLADRTRLKQVFINLLSNAIKYNHEHGMVEVKCTASTPEHILISIKDTGPGMTPEQMKNLFQPFNRLGQENSTVEGTGIGLVTSKRLVELMGGLIGVQSNVGVGSVFWFELTSAEPPQIESEIAESVPQSVILGENSIEQKTLLYVEDNPANMKLVEELIARRLDIHLLRADSGNLGIELANKYIPDVILMDINLPGINGIQALKILREDPATAHIPVIALSANAMPRDIKNGLDAGFFRYLTKPIKVNEFMETLDTALLFAENGVNQKKHEAGIVV